MRDVAPAGPGRAVLPWRVVAGALLHLVLPAYLFTLAIDWAVFGPAAPTAAVLLGFAGAVSWRFCLGYAAFAVAASLGAALADPPLRRARDRREARDPAAAARRAACRVDHALRVAGRIGGTSVATPAIAAATADVRAAAWDHRDERCHAIAADLARAADAFAAADASASPPDRDRIATFAADALHRVAAAVREVAAERARLDAGDATTHARYIAERYGASPLDPTGPDRD